MLSEPYAPIPPDPEDGRRRSAACDPGRRYLGVRNGYAGTEHSKEKGQELPGADPAKQGALHRLSAPPDRAVYVLERLQRKLLV